MGVEATSTQLTQISLAQEVGTSVMKLSMDSTKQQASGFADMMKVQTRMMERSVAPHLGGSIDTKV